MLKTLGAAALQDIMGMLWQDSKFFSLPAEARKAHFSRHLPHYSATFRHYMTEVSEKQFLADAEAAIQVISGLERAHKNGFLEALASDISKELGEALDQLDSDFFFLSYDKRIQRLQTLFTGDSALARHTRDSV